MKKRIILIFLIVYSVFAKEPNEEFCQKVECGEISPSNMCIKVESKTSIFQECPSGQICDIMTDDPAEDAECTDIKTSMKKLPSLPCNDNDDCLSGNCTNNICVGIGEGEECTSADQCEYGKTCRKSDDNNDDTYKCLDPITTGNECILDTDCVIESGCLNHTCTLYFSLDNDQEARDYDNEDFNFCKSGYSNDLGICKNISLANQITECSQSSPCVYNISDSEANVTIHTNCLCGYNPDGKQYCLIGSGNRNYTKYIQKLKDYHLYNKNCHLSERTASGCQKDLLSTDKNVLTQIHELINAKYWAKSNNKMINASECVYKVEMPDYDRSLDNGAEPEPSDEGNCAIYKCDSKNNGEFCAKSKYGSSFSINVSLSDICPEDITCKIGGDPNEIFYNKTNISAKCSSVSTNRRYPGEKCEVDTECVYPLDNPSSQFHKCQEGRCNGMDEGGICSDNSWCLAGYFCDQFTGKCKEQLEEDQKCLTTKDCQNHLVCLNNKCSDSLYGLSEGQKVPQNEGEEFQKKFCQSGQVMNGVCVSYNDFDNKLSDKEYRKCNFGSYCKYKVNGLPGVSVKYDKCPCGFNSEGQGYCPHYHEYFKSDWYDYREALKKNYDNECHTENRYNCYNNDELDTIKQLRNKLERGHLFYKAVPCAELVLKSTYLNVKKILLVLISSIFGLL